MNKFEMELGEKPEETLNKKSEEKLKEQIKEKTEEKVGEEMTEKPEEKPAIEMEENVDEKVTSEPEEEEIKWFECKACGMEEEYHFKETKPKLYRNIIFAEDTYIMKDPFTHPDKKQFIVLGSDCYICRKPVCQAPECSLFFKHRYCQNCASKNKSKFPEQLHGRIKEQSKS